MDTQEGLVDLLAVLGRNFRAYQIHIDERDQRIAQLEGALAECRATMEGLRNRVTELEVGLDKEGEDNGLEG